jgi:hypothetical protein
MTEQCRSVMAECDFPPEEWRRVERWLCRHSPAQVLALVWGKDPDGRHLAEWFDPFFDHSYVRRVVTLDPEPDFSDAFWEALEEASGMFDMLSTFDLAHVQVMSADVPRMRRAFAQAKVKKVPYVRKVWEGMAPTRAVERTRVDFEVGNSGPIETRSLL